MTVQSSFLTQNQASQRIGRSLSRGGEIVKGYTGSCSMDCRAQWEQWVLDVAVLCVCVSAIQGR